MLCIYNCNTDEECKQMVQDAIDNGVNISDHDNIALIRANEYGFLETVKLLIDNGAIVTTQDNVALRWASHKGYIDLAQLLIDNGADVTAENNDAIKHADDFDYEVTLSLLKYIRYSDTSAITRSTMTSKQKAREAFVNGTYDSDMVRKTNMTRGPEMVQFLLDHGATL